MLYSAVVGFVVYYVALFVVGVLVKVNAIQGALIGFAVMCFVGAYLTRNYTRGMSTWLLRIGAGIVVFLAFMTFILPVLAGSGHTWLVILAIVAGCVMYAFTRRHIYRHYARRNDDGTLIAPPFGREWCRWLFIVVM